MASVGSSDVPEVPRNGGLGGRSERVESGLTEIKDARLSRLAVRKRWDIPEEGRAAVIQRQIQIATEERFSANEATNAAKCLTAMEAQNLEQEKRDNPALHESGMTVNIQNNACTLSLDDRRTGLLGIIAAASDRARAVESGGTTDAPAEPQ